MDEDPTMAGGVGDGTTQNEPDQETQTTMMNTVAPEGQEATVASNSDPMLTAQGNAAVELGGAAPRVEIPGRELAESRHIDHDIDLAGSGKQKSRTGLMIGVIAGVLALVLGGLAIWFFAFYSNPEKVAFDAIENLITAENVTMNGSIAILPEATAESSFSSIILNIDSSSKTLPNSTTATLLITPNDDAEDAEAIQIQLSTVYLADGVAYIQISGLMDAMDELGLDTATSSELSAIFDTLERIDNEWWQISVPNLISEMELEDDEAAGLNAIYACAVDAMNSDASGEIASLYKANKFVQVEAVKSIIDSAGNETLPNSGYKYYEVSLDSERLANFVNALPNTTVADTFYDCYNTAVEEYNIYEPIDASDISEASADDFELPDDLHIYLEISRFGHKLRSIAAEQQDGDVTISGSVLFQYEAGEVIEPEDYRSITELFDELTELFSQFALVGEATEPDSAIDDADDADSDVVNGMIDDDDDWYYDDEDDDYWGYDEDDEEDDDWEDDE